MDSFEVNGMSCGHCAAAVTRSIQQKDPAAQVKVDLAQGTVAVSSTLARNLVAQAIEEAGYEVKAAAA